MTWWRTLKVCEPSTCLQEEPANVSKLIIGCFVDRIIVKALDHDDDTEVVQVVRLFERSHGRTFPLIGVYDPRFWKSHAGLRFTSLIAVEGHKVVAHIALRRDLDQPTHIQLYLPAIDPGYVDFHGLIESELLALIDRLAQRQQWKLLYGYALGDLCGMNLLTDPTLGLREAAVWPQAIPLNRIEDGLRADVTFVQRVLQVDGPQETLYVPEAHREMTAWLYRSVGLEPLFTFSSDTGRSPAQLGREMQTVSADRRAVEHRTYRPTAISLSLVEPGLLADPQATIAQLAARSTRFPFQYIGCNMRDPRTVGFAEQLERTGYRFCGVLPFIAGRHNILYAAPSAASYAPSRAHARPSPLVRYMSDYRFTDAIAGSPISEPVASEGF